MLCLFNDFSQGVGALEISIIIIIIKILVNAKPCINNIMLFTFTAAVVLTTGPPVP